MVSQFDRRVVAIDRSPDRPTVGVYTSTRERSTPLKPRGATPMIVYVVPPTGTACPSTLVDPPNCDCQKS